MFYICMKIKSVYTPIKKCFNVLKTKVSPAREPASSKTVSGLETLGEQNRAFVRADNQVEPLITDCKSTKELLNYAKERCIEGLNSSQPYEHTVIIDTKQNKVLAEYKGDARQCRISNFESLVTNPDYTILIHGHPSSYPLSGTDVKVLLDSNVNQVIAVNKNGEFSLAAKRTIKPDKKITESAKHSYQEEVTALLDDFYGHTDTEFYKVLVHGNLKNHANDMGLRYLTNYSYIINHPMC